jgi:hypothetical protein
LIVPQNPHTAETRILNAVAQGFDLIDVAVELSQQAYVTRIALDTQLSRLNSVLAQIKLKQVTLTNYIRETIREPQP